LSGNKASLAGVGIVAARTRRPVAIMTFPHRYIRYDGSFIMGKEDFDRAYRALPNGTIVG
jgi:hypothetical protein